LRRRRFPKLDDKEWLLSKYRQELLSPEEIGNIIGCSRDAVRKALKSHDIPIRTVKEARAISCQKNRISKYDLLNDPEWLNQKYNVEKKGLNAIKEMAGAKASNSVRQSLIRFGFKVRDRVDAKRLYQGEDHFVFDKDVVLGSMLGDASFDVYNKYSDESWPYFKKKNKHYAHVLYVAQKLFTKNPENRIFPTVENLNGKEFPMHVVTSLCKEDLLPIYREWYPPSNDYKKLVPRSLELTPEMNVRELEIAQDFPPGWTNVEYPMRHEDLRTKQRDHIIRYAFPAGVAKKLAERLYKQYEHGK